MKVIAVYNMKGGVGKTTAAVNLAYLAAATGARTLLWDLDAQAASTFAFRVDPKVEGFGKKSLHQVETLTEAIRATDYDNLDLLPADFAYRNIDQFLQRLDQPDDGLAEVLQKLGRGYTHVLLDCPPGLSTLSESVFRAADLVLVPTIPTVLSLRTLGRLVEHFGERGEATKVAAFLSMVDKRKSLHRQVAEWALRQPGVFLSAQIPYASIVEQMSARRMPLAAVARQEPATTAFVDLWFGVRARLAEPPPATTSERRRSAAFAKAVGDVISRVGGEHKPEPEAVNANNVPAASSSAPGDCAEVCAHRIKVNDGEAFDSLVLELSADGPPSVTMRLAHIFDTDERILHQNGYLLQLLEESGRFAVTAEMESGSAESVSREIAAIDGHWAADILAGSLSPITVLERRLGHPIPAVVSEVVAAAGNRPLRRVSWRKVLRRRPGPINIALEDAVVTLHFEFDRVSSPGNKVDYEITATTTGSASHNIERALHQFFSHTGVTWQPVTVPKSPAPAITRLAGVTK